MKRVISGRGKNVQTLEMSASTPDDATIATAILGPTGNLKVPTLRIGDTLIVGFNESVYNRLFR